MGDLDASTWEQLYLEVTRAIRGSYREQLRQRMDGGANDVQAEYEAAATAVADGNIQWVKYSGAYNVGGDEAERKAFSEDSEQYRWQVYRQLTCPEAYEVLRQEGLHGRTIHWVPQVQTRAAPGTGGGRDFVAARPIAGGVGGGVSVGVDGSWAGYTVAVLKVTHTR